jgi:hypothetical protein
MHGTTANRNTPGTQSSTLNSSDHQPCFRQLVRQPTQPPNAYAGTAATPTKPTTREGVRLHTLLGYRQGRYPLVQREYGLLQPPQPVVHRAENRHLRPTIRQNLGCELGRALLMMASNEGWAGVACRKCYRRRVFAPEYMVCTGQQGIGVCCDLELGRAMPDQQKLSGGTKENDIAQWRRAQLPRTMCTLNFVAVASRWAIIGCLWHT